MAEATLEQTQAIVKSLGFFANVSGLFEEVADGLELQSKRFALLESNIGALLNINAYQLEPPPAAVQEQESISAITSRTTSRAFDLAGLGLILPFLFNQDARNYVSEFANSLFGTESVETFNTALKSIGAILAGVFAYKVFKQVGDTIETFKRLSQVVSALFVMTDEGTESAIEERKEYEEKKKRDKERRKKIRENRVKRAKRLQKFKNIFGAFKFGGPIGLAIGAVVGVGIGTMIDVVSEADAKEQEKEEKALDEDTDVPSAADTIETKSILEHVRNNIVNQFSMGLLSWSNIKELFGGNTPEQEKQNREEISGADLGSTSEFSGMNFGGDGDSSEQTEMDAEPVNKETIMSEPAPNASESSFSQTPSIESPVMNGDVINNTSETINNKKKMNSSATILTINNIDNSTVVALNKSVSSSTPVNIPVAAVGAA